MRTEAAQPAESAVAEPAAAESTFVEPVVAEPTAVQPEAAEETPEASATETRGEE